MAKYTYLLTYLPVVTLMLKSKYGNTVTVKANVVPKISGDIQRLPIRLKNRFSIQKSFRLADKILYHNKLSPQLLVFSLGVTITMK